VIGTNTNPLLRLLVRDDPEQTERVMELLTECRGRRETVHVSLIVLCELAWVLRSTYGKSRREIVDAIEGLMQADPFQPEQPDLLRAALEQYRNGPADFADYLIGALNLAAGCRHTVTFDRSLRGAAGFQLL